MVLVATLGRCAAWPAVKPAAIRHKISAWRPVRCSAPHLYFSASWSFPMADHPRSPASPLLAVTPRDGREDIKGHGLPSQLLAVWAGDQEARALPWRKGSPMTPEPGRAPAAGPPGRTGHQYGERIILSYWRSSPRIS